MLQNPIFVVIKVGMHSLIVFDAKFIFYLQEFYKKRHFYDIFNWVKVIQAVIII
jgi:hypothetical protein